MSANDENMILENETNDKVHNNNAKQSIDESTMNINKKHRSELLSDLHMNLGMLWLMKLNHASKRYLELAAKIIPDLKNILRMTF